MSTATAAAPDRSNAKSMSTLVKVIKHVNSATTISSVAPKSRPADEPLKAEARKPWGTGSAATPSATSNSSAVSDARTRAVAWREEQRQRVADSDVLEDIGEVGRTMDSERWRKRVGIEGDTRVFVCSQAYPDMRDALLARSWKQNPDFYSPHYDMKITLKAKDVQHRELASHQIVNHYEKSNAICTKAGLLHCLRTVNWFAPVDSNSIYPRAYDLADPTDYQDFIDDFRVVEAEKILRTAIVTVLLAAVAAGVVTAEQLVPGGVDRHAAGGVAASGAVAGAALGGSRVPFDRTLYLPPSQIVGLLCTPAVIAFLSSGGEHAPAFNCGVLKAALDVTNKRCREWDDQMLDDPAQNTTQSQTVTPKEWEAIRYCDLFTVGGPVEQAPLTLKREASQRQKEQEDNAKRDKAVKRALKRKGKEAASSVLAASSATGSALEAASASAAAAAKQLAADEAAGNDESTGDVDDDDDSESSGDESDSGGGGAEGEDGDERKRLQFKNGGAVGQVQLRAWREKLEREGADTWAFSDTVGDPEPTVSSSKDGSFRSLSRLDSATWRAMVSAVGAVNAGPGYQSSLNGCPPMNVWIVKPAGKSRGRGIECENSLSQILLQRGGESKESHWIVQKYIERPLLIKGRKWDIRQWVLVSSWNPLTVWFYKKCYLRFCSYPFELGNLSNRYIHLSNNSVQKHSAAFEASDIEGNMWHMADFASWLQEREKEGAWDGLTYIPVTEDRGAQSAGKVKSVSSKKAGMAARPNNRVPTPPGTTRSDPGLGTRAAAAAPPPVMDAAQMLLDASAGSIDDEGASARMPISGCSDIWGQVLQPQIRQAVSWALQSAQDTIDGRPASFELYGFDFMIDSDLHPWLIEINSSPDMSYSTAVTEELVKEASEGIMQVVVDHRDWEKEVAANKAAARAEKKAAAAAAGSAGPAGLNTASSWRKPPLAGGSLRIPKPASSSTAAAQPPAVAALLLQQGMDGDGDDVVTEPTSVTSSTPSRPAVSRAGTTPATAAPSQTVTQTGSAPDEPDTGNWECIYRSPIALGTALTCTATGIQCVGTQIKDPNERKKKAGTLSSSSGAAVVNLGLQRSQRPHSAEDGSAVPGTSSGIASGVMGRVKAKLAAASALDAAFRKTASFSTAGSATPFPVANSSSSPTAANGASAGFLGLSDPALQLPAARIIAPDGIVPGQGKLRASTVLARSMSKTRNTVKLTTGVLDIGLPEVPMS